MFDDIPEELQEAAPGMSETVLQSIVSAEIDEAVTFIDQDIGPKRAEAMRYYRGDPFGNEEEGRSQVVSRDVADTVNAIMPSLMRVFFGPENVVEFVPESEEDEALAEQQTDYVNYIVTRDNDGFGVFHAVIKDALRSKVGFIKYFWDDSVEVSTRRYTGLDEDAMALLNEELEQAGLEWSGESAPDPNTGLMDVRLTIKKPTDRVAIEAIPPEEFLISRDAKSIDTARFVGHRRDLTVSELVAMGYDKELVLEHGGGDGDLATSDERLARTPWSEDAFHQGASADPSMRVVRYVEGYLTVDYDGDGIAELRKVCTIGGKVVHQEPVDERPFAAFMCDPEPHAFFGESLADKVMDLQKMKSALWRAGLDSMSSSIFPRTVVGTQGGVEMDDVQNSEVGAIIRAKDVSQVVALATPDVSPSALGWIGYADEVRENRTGMSKVSMGLDAEALQNTTATAAEGQFSRSQERIELIARIMASGMRRLFRGISGLVAANQRQERMVKLRNSWTPIDPRKWRSDMDVQPNVALGGGSAQQKGQVLGLILAKQEMLMDKLGPQNPIVTLKHYYATLAKFIECAGFKNPQAFFRDPSSEEAQMEQAQKQPAPDPKMVEIEQKTQLEMAKLEAEIGLKREQMMAEMQLKREQMVLEADMRRHSAMSIGDVRMGGEVG